MDPLLIVSPHLDDAVLSLGQMMAGRPDCIVATVFTAVPDVDGLLTTYDRDCGFQSASQAMAARRREDARAMETLQAEAVYLGFIDCQYREVVVGQPVVEEVVAARIAETVDNLGLDRVVVAGPVGLVHPDHHITRRAVELACREMVNVAVELWLYEDLPARVLWPESVPDGFAWWRGMGWRIDDQPGFLGTGPEAVKRKAIGAYRSQITAPEFGGPGLHNVLVPERVWRVTR